MKKHRVALSALICLPALLPPAWTQQQPPQKDINIAIEKGTRYLIEKFPKEIPPATTEFELIVYTLIHAELDPTKVSPLKKGIEDLLNFEYPLKDPNTGAPLTYRIGVRNLALHALLVNIKNKSSYQHLKNRVSLIQKKIAEGAQFLVDTQKNNGQWHYKGVAVNTPQISKLVTGKPPEQSRHNQAAAKIAWENASSMTGTMYTLVPKYGADPKRRTDLGKPVEMGTERGDNSNTQYGILGLIAAEMSGVEVPRTTWELALKWFEQAKYSDGGYGYIAQEGGSPYGSMTTAAVVVVAAANKYLGKDYNKDPLFTRAVQWLGDNFTVTENPKFNHKNWSNNAYYYYMYGLERAGAFSGLQKFGTHDWYAEGAAQLLKLQQPDGSWPKGSPETELISTSFSVLFLKRASEGLIDSGPKEKYIDNIPKESGGEKE